MELPDGRPSVRTAANVAMQINYFNKDMLLAGMVSAFYLSSSYPCIYSCHHNIKTTDGNTQTLIMTTADTFFLSVSRTKLLKSHDLAIECAYIHTCIYI